MNPFLSCFCQLFGPSNEKTNKCIRHTEALLVTREELLPQCQYGGGWELRDGGTSKEHFSRLVDKPGGGKLLLRCNGCRKTKDDLPVHALAEACAHSTDQPPTGLVKVSLQCGHVMQ